MPPLCSVVVAPLASPPTCSSGSAWPVRRWAVSFPCLGCASQGELLSSCLGGGCGHRAPLHLPDFLGLISVLPQTQRKESASWDGRGIAPFTPDSNTLVVVDGKSDCSHIFSRSAVWEGWALSRHLEAAPGALSALVGHGP